MRKGLELEIDSPKVNWSDSAILNDHYIEKDLAR